MPTAHWEISGSLICNLSNQILYSMPIKPQDFQSVKGCILVLLLLLLLHPH